MLTFDEMQAETDKTLREFLRQERATGGADADLNALRRAYALGLMHGAVAASDEADED